MYVNEKKLLAFLDPAILASVTNVLHRNKTVSCSNILNLLFRQHFPFPFWPHTFTELYSFHISSHALLIFLLATRMKMLLSIRATISKYITIFKCCHLKIKNDTPRSIDFCKQILHPESRLFKLNQ